MKYFSSKSIMMFVCISLLVITTSSNAFVYVVKEHDKFSKILGKYIPGPVWGKRGSYEKFISYNPQIKDPNLILPGDEINLPIESPIADVKVPDLVREPSQAVPHVENKLDVKPELNAKTTEKDESSFDLSGTEMTTLPKAHHFTFPFSSGLINEKKNFSDNV